MSHENKLVMMANQIGKFFAPQTNMDAPEMIADHIGKFWDPRMRRQIYAHLDAGGDGMDAPVREAIKRLQERDKAKQTRA
ncbi:formate dehydrogenase subunit delta [Ferrovibrio sp.]|uniref:formate dehydrogenase subunit delta n=1 Tax=Ferrovibrio sp. TaxID=1917215 RepID=UPI0025C5A7D3|nr:formate dehydrogenase subunit delta [Ferrovibrio sp.]MBX3453233.1 formate dehydrogenase subunit delta [Ferrovibrio sp.]